MNPEHPGAEGGPGPPGHIDHVGRARRGQLLGRRGPQVGEPAGVPADDGRADGEQAQADNDREEPVQADH
jgi:hypothetical protein